MKYLREIVERRKSIICCHDILYPVLLPLGEYPPNESSHTKKSLYQHQFMKNWSKQNFNLFSSFVIPEKCWSDFVEPPRVIQVLVAFRSGQFRPTCLRRWKIPKRKVKIVARCVFFQERRLCWWLSSVLALSYWETRWSTRILFRLVIAWKMCNIRREKFSLVRRAQKFRLFVLVKCDKFGAF